TLSTLFWPLQVSSFMGPLYYSFEVFRNGELLDRRVAYSFEIGTIHYKGQNKNLIKMGKDVNGDTIPDLEVYGPRTFILSGS
ncbi:MAG: hypothetical protein Q7O66_04140, partial [Dehalococcoidia bacterium]|nr:hypothetical protein [Dehalococcoidia bacterium]